MQCHKLGAKIIKIVQHVQAAAKGFAGLVPAWAQQKICYSLLENLQEIFDQGSDLLADAIKFESNNTILALKLYIESLIIL